jgi:uncharacterized cysteine cluster protein YcgN (CxxCxxCC family)
MPWAARAFAVYTMVGKCLTRTQIEMLSGFPVCCAYAATLEDHALQVLHRACRAMAPIIELLR